ncbi:MAG: hypothetical protein R3C58_07560 [Parvularculaceae bacterium]
MSRIHDRSHTVNVSAQHRRQIGVDYCRFAARHDFREWADIVTCGNLREADFTRKACQKLLMCGMFVGVHQHDCDGAIPGVKSGLKIPSRLVEIERAINRAAIEHALVNFNHRAVEKRRLLDVKRKCLGAGLIADLDDVAKAPCHRKNCRFAFLFEQRIGGDGRAHLDGADSIERHRIASRDAQQLTNAVHSRVVIGLWIFREHFSGMERAVWRRATMSVNVPSRSIQNCHFPGVAALMLPLQRA